MTTAGCTARRSPSPLAGHAVSARIAGLLRRRQPPAGTGSAAELPAAAAAAPNVFIYHLDDLRDAFPGGIDPLQFMPKTRSG